MRNKKKITFNDFIDSLPMIFSDAEYRQLQEGNKTCNDMFDTIIKLCNECSVRKTWRKDKPYPNKCWDCMEKSWDAVTSALEGRFPFYDKFCSGVNLWT